MPALQKNHRYGVAFLLVAACALLSTGCERSATPSAKKRTAPDEVKPASTPSPAPATGSTPAVPSETPTPEAPAETPVKEEPAPEKAGPITLVSQGKALCTIILSPMVDDATEEIVRTFVATVQRSTGVEIPIVRGDAPSAEPPEGGGLLFIGDSAPAQALGLRTADLPEEGYRILSRGNRLFILGRDGSPADSGDLSIVSRPTRWALNHLLEEQLGVRWLWPGKLGTYVPRRDHLTIPAIDLSYQPTLFKRELRISVGSQRPIIPGEDHRDLDERLRKEAAQWAENHQQGQRGGIRFGHAFESWWENYGKDHPDYFALPPPGIEQPHFNRPNWVKLRLSNPAVIEQIAAEYEAAGAPEYWNVCPNDGAGFDLSKETLAWDLPRNQSPDDIWRARGNLTARYVKFWNLLYERLKQVNPKVKISTYAYHSYKTPPPPARPLTAKAAVAIVPGYKDYHLWKGWADQEGTEIMYLRPNWGHIGANAPYLPLGHMAKFIRFAWENRMRGFDLDTILGYWSTQGPNYYLWARMMTRPDLSRDDIVREYSEAFGAGAAKIRDYIDYWERVTEDYSYTDNYASEDQAAKRGRYARLVREGKIEDNWVFGPRQVLPFIYNDRTLAPAFSLLDQAKTAIGTTDDEALRRVDYLRDGLAELIATRDLVALSRKIKPNSSRQRIDELRRKASELDRLREELSARHVIWGARITNYENRRKVPMRPETLGLPPLNLDGQ